MNQRHGFRLDVSGADAAFLHLPASSEGPVSVARSIEVTSAIHGYSGPDVVLNLDAEGRLLGIEIVE